MHKWPVIREEPQAKRVIVTTEIIYEFWRWKNGIPISSNKDISCMNWWQKSTFCFLVGSYFIPIPIGFHDLIFKRTAFYIWARECVWYVIELPAFDSIRLCVNDTIIASISLIRIFVCLISFISSMASNHFWLVLQPSFLFLIRIHLLFSIGSFFSN